MNALYNLYFLIFLKQIYSATLMTTEAFFYG